MNAGPRAYAPPDGRAPALYVRHAAGLLSKSGAAEIVREFSWFPLLSDSNSRSFSALTLVILPGVGAAAELTADVQLAQGREHRLHFGLGQRPA